MNHYHQELLSRLTHAANATDQAHQARATLDQLDPTRLATVIRLLAEISHSIVFVLSDCGRGARILSHDPSHNTIAVLCDEFHRTADTARTAAQHLRRKLKRANGVAWEARTTRQPQADQRPPTTGTDIRELLETADVLLHSHGRPVMDPAALFPAVTELDRVADHLAGLTDRCATAAGRLAERATTTKAADAHHATERAVTGARACAGQLRRDLATVRHCAEQIHEQTTRKRGA